MNQPKKERFKTSVGGQALMEGIMMRGPKQMCCAVRKPDGTIETKLDPTPAHGVWMKIPLVRGAIDVELSNKSICLTGDFDYGSKQEVQERLSEIGATVVSSVTRKTDILLIGEKGSESWACGTYGTKAKKAIELRSKGYPIMILKEKDVQL